MRCDTGISLAAALRELECVHRRDQAHLLREACALACAGSALGRLYVAGFEYVPRGFTRESARSAWDRACREEIETAQADEFHVNALLPRLLELPATLWPSPTTLARAALALEPCHAGRVDLARARIAEGDADQAIAELRSLLDEGPAPSVRGVALEALAMALECEGDDRSSLGCYEAAVLESRSDPRVTVALLALALRVGDPYGVSLATRRLALLDLSVAGTRRRFDRALRAARERAARERAERDRHGSRRGAADAGRWEILEMALAGSEACSEVARELI